MFLKFFRWFALRFRTITYAKTVEFLSGFLFNSFLEPETKESFCISEQ